MASEQVLVTGAAGFIGSQVAELLLAANCRVIGIDNLNNAYDTRLKEWRLARLQAYPHFAFHRADITDRAALDEVWVDDIDAVINLAARAGVRQSVIDPWAYFETNTTGTLNLLEMCRSRGVRKFILASTSSLYGAHNPLPYSEEANTDRPLSPYAASKKAAEVLCATYNHLYGIDVSVFRYFTVYGPAGRPDMSIFRFVQWIDQGLPVTIFGDGQQRRDFTYVEDIARGTVAGLDRTGYEIMNLGSDRPIVLMDVIRMIENRLGKKANLVIKPAHPADVIATWANVTKARAIGWQPTTPFEKGLDNVIEWYLANREWAAHIATD
jgi:UDP-glucuronate 4-epimerase